jgi:hypothetical protein
VEEYIRTSGVRLDETETTGLVETIDRAGFNWQTGNVYRWLERASPATAGSSLWAWIWICFKHCDGICARSLRAVALSELDAITFAKCLPTNR